jgi:hypothetical protein
MRYLIQLVDKSTMTVSQREGEAVGQALVAGEAIVLRGAYINPRFISVVKPIKKGWFPAEYVRQQERIELASPDAMTLIPPPGDA